MTDMMSMFPAGDGAQVTLANWRTGPFNTWAFHHVREIVPSANIAHDPDRVRVLYTAPMDTRALTVGDLGFDDLLSETHTDGLVVLHRGKVIVETYRNGMGPRDPHILMSVSKSMLGLLAGVLVARGEIDLDATIDSYLPEMAATAYQGATVRNLLDMRAGVLFDEDYLATEGPIIEYRKATNWNPLAPGQAPSDLRSFFLTLTERDGAPGGPFKYISTSTDLLAWVFERATSTRYADLMSRHIWQQIGAECPAYITVDRLGAPRAAGGMCVTTRDLARVGQMVVEGGDAVSLDWIEDLATKGDVDAWDSGNFAADFAGIPMHYRSKWYTIRDKGPLLMGWGIHGQTLLVDRGRELVLARHSSHPEPVNMPSKKTVLALFAAIRDSVE